MKSISAMHCAVVATALLLGVVACTDPTRVGADLLEGDQVGVDFTDTLTLHSATYIGDTVNTYSPTTVLANYLFGDYKDPVFGKSKATIYTQMRLLQTFSGSIEEVDFSGATIDSIILVLTYDTLANYGRLDQTFGLEVSELDELPDDLSYYNSDATFATKPGTLGFTQFKPSYDSLDVIYYNSGDPDTSKIIPHLRVPLDPAFGQRLLQLDTSAYGSDDAFLEKVKGIRIRPTFETEGIVSFNVISSVSGVYMYYTKDGKKTQYQFPFSNAVTTLNYEHDYTNSIVKPYIDDALLADTLTFMQGMRGLYTVISIPNIEKLQGRIINKAELTITVAGLSGDNGTYYPPASQILAYYRDTDGKLAQIHDVALGFQISQLDNIFGGLLEEGENGQPSQYKMNITGQIQRMADGEVPDEIYLLVRSGVRFADRVTLCGARHPSYPMDLRITFTKL